MSRVWGFAVAALLLLGTAPDLLAQGNLECQRCHGELELLRQHVRSLPEARRMLVIPEELAASAHGGMGCVDCHTGFARFPHPDAAQTRSCSSCHEAAAADWRQGAHAGHEGPLGVEGGEPVTCTQCHGVHTVADVASLGRGPELVRMNERCTSCHETQRLPADDPHQGDSDVGCHSCHAPHDVRSPRDPESWMAGQRQAEVCAACHEETVARWRTDVHGQAVMAMDPEDYDPRYGTEGPPTCATCHGAHPTARAGDRGFSVAAVERCIACHQHAGNTFFGTYHGKASALGSVISATCVDCHSAHQIFPASDPRSTVAPDNLVTTCQACHEYARPAFVLYDSHPEPFNRHRNPYIFYSFWFMNSLLIGTLVVFGLHTLLWWVRIEIDRRRGIIHGPGQRHGHGPGHGAGEGQGGGEDE
jgi:hypothetical protein